MKTRYTAKRNFWGIICLLLGVGVFTACDDEVDNLYSRNQYNLDLTASSDQILLDETKPDDVALTLEWTPASDWGNDFAINYEYEIDLVGSTTGSSIKEYEDGGVFKRSYTNKELQDMLVDTWGQLTSTTGKLKFTVTASFEGPRLVIPEVSMVNVKVKTYGPKQFLADQLFMSGTGVGSEDLEISQSSTNSLLYTYTGDLMAGTINFPIIYGDEVKENVVSSTTSSQQISAQAMDAVILDNASAGSWVIAEAGKYRVSVNFANKTVTIIPFGDVLDLEKLYIDGTAVGSEIEVTQTLENENLYAFRGELQAGTLYLPILFEGATTYSIVPNASGEQAIDDGNAVSFSQNDTETAATSNYWNIQTAGIYRIVVNIETKQITIYSPATDLQSKEVSWNNTVLGINPYTSSVDELWMFGGFNSWAGDGNGFTGFDDKYKLTQSLANPYVFGYKGDVLPRDTNVDS